VTYLEVATTENAVLQAQLSNVTIQTRRMSASVLLVKALGGGWQRGESKQAGGPGEAQYPLAAAVN
jgi:outer membrane protein TolC